MDAGVLYVVATPIGNLDDITRRALQVLGRVDLILAEDTRHSLPMLRRFGITTPLAPLHEHNERRMVPKVSARLAAGASIALICDAGTPLISDPGYELIRALRARGQQVVPIPGPSALTCALCAAGVPTNRFVFEGFLPAKQPQRLRRLQLLAPESRTLVVFESPHRILSTLHDLVTVFGGARRAVLARELTKVFETFRQGHLAELQTWLQSQPEQQRGEFVILIEGAAEPPEPCVALTGQQVLNVLLESLPLKQAVAIAARLTGQKRNLLYRQAVQAEQQP